MHLRKIRAVRITGLCHQLNLLSGLSNILKNAGLRVLCWFHFGEVAYFGLSYVQTGFILLLLLTILDCFLMEIMLSWKENVRIPSLEVQSFLSNLRISFKIPPCDVRFFFAHNSPANQICLLFSFSALVWWVIVSLFCWVHSQFCDPEDRSMK